MVTDLGSLVRMTVGCTKYPVESSAAKLTEYDGENECRIVPTASTDEDLAPGVLRLLDVAGDLVKGRAATV